MDRATEQRWSPASARGRLDLPTWPSAQPAGLEQALRWVDPEVLINCECTGVSFWDGVIPDPVDGSTS